MRALLILALALGLASPADALPLKMRRVNPYTPPPAATTLPTTRTVNFLPKTLSGFGGDDLGCNGCGPIVIDSQSGPVSGAFRISTTSITVQGNLLVPEGSTAGSYGSTNKGTSGVLPNGTYTVNAHDTVSGSAIVVSAVVSGSGYSWRGQNTLDGSNSNQLQTVIQRSSAPMVAKGDKLLMRAGSVWNPGNGDWDLSLATSHWPTFTQTEDLSQRVTIECETHDATVDANGWPNYAHPCKMGKVVVYTKGASNIGSVDDGLTFDYMYFYTTAGNYNVPFVGYYLTYGMGTSVEHSRFSAPVFHQSTNGSCLPLGGGPSYLPQAGCDAVTPQPYAATQRGGYFKNNRMDMLSEGVHAEGSTAEVTYIDSNYSTDTFGDIYHISGPNWELTNNFGTNQNAISLAVHGDPFQTGGITAGVDGTTYDHMYINGNFFSRGTSRTTYNNANNSADFQSCLFWQTVLGHSYRNTGIQVKWNICGTTGDEAPSFSEAQDPIVAFNTMTTDKQGTFDSGLAAQLSLSGTATGGTILDNLFGSVDTGGQTGMTFTPASQTFTNSAASYAATFTNYNHDPKNWTGVCVAFTPSRTGVAKNADGTYKGKYFPTKDGDLDGCGELNDGTVFVP